MKSRPFVLYLVLGAAAVALGLTFLSTHRPGAGHPATAAVNPLGLPLPSDAPALPRDQTPPAAAFNGSAPNSVPPVASGSFPKPGTTAPGSPAQAAGAALTPGQAAPIDVVRVRHMISDFHTLTGENPVGTNAEIMKQMMGGNSHEATLGPPEGLSLNAQGELVDPWGTPYFFHQLSRDKMEVRSAGPDKMMWTADDVIAR